MNCGTAAEERPLSVAFLSPSWPADAAANGIVSYVDRITASLRRAGHRPCVLAASCPAPGPGPDVYCLDEGRGLLARALDRATFRLDPESALRRTYAAKILRAAARATAERGVELLEMEETFGLAQLVRPRLAIPLVVRLHGPHFASALPSAVSTETSLRKRVRLEGTGIASADAVSAVSKEILERTRAYYGMPLDGAVVIPNPAPIVPRERRWRLAECEKSRILFVGRFDRIKGGDVVIDCMRILMRSFPDLRLTFVGPDNGFVDDRGKCWPFAEYLAERVPGAAASVEWTGIQPQASLGPLRRQAMLTIVASRYETFGLAALEAMAYGCPLVATRAGGIAETVADGVNGLLCPPGDPGAMAATVARLLRDPSLAAGLGHRAGQDAAGAWHPDTIARETARFHRSVLDR